MALIHEIVEAATELLDQLESGMALRAQSRLEELLEKFHETPGSSSKIPQLLVTLSVDGGDLIVESPAHGHRHQTQLSPAEAGTRMMRILSEQKKRIDGEMIEARKRRFRQPDWILIAKHPQVEIREITVTRLPPGPGISNQRLEKTLEELDL